MKLFTTLLAAATLVVTALTGPAALAQEGFVITTPIVGCDADMVQFCSDVTPGENRPLMCLLAHKDHLTHDCRVGMLDAALANESAAAALNYASEACTADRNALCPNVPMDGSGNLSRCLVANSEQLSESCTTALQETGLWDLILKSAANN
jgi:hypothetical protein